MNYAAILSACNKNLFHVPQAVYYCFAIFGMMIFENAIPLPESGNRTVK
jgi:hypothetical protein